jgi:glycosyltransferase involved in cell wall biosynthesis
LARILRFNQLDVIFQIHNVLPHEQRFYDRLMARFALGQAGGYIVHSQREQNRLQGLLPKAKRLRQSILPLLSQMNMTHYAKAEARQRLDLPETALVLLFFGIVRAYKGLCHLIDATALLRQAGLDVYVLVVGEFWDERSTYEHQIEKLGLVDRIHVVARYVPNEEVGVYFSAADIYVAPHVAGSQSGSYKLALAYNIPVVMTAAIAEDAGNEWTRIVPPADPAAMADAIKALQSSSFVIPPPAISGWDELVAGIHQI